MSLRKFAAWPLVVGMLAAGCGSATTITRTAAVPAPKVSTAATAPAPTTPIPSTPAVPATPNTPTSPTRAVATNCGQVAQGHAYEITAANLSCATAQTVADAWVHATRGGGQSPNGTVTVGTGSSQFICSAVFRGRLGSVSCQSPGSQGVISFRARL